MQIVGHRCCSWLLQPQLLNERFSEIPFLRKHLFHVAVQSLWAQLSSPCSSVEFGSGSVTSPNVALADLRRYRLRILQQSEAQLSGLTRTRSLAATSTTSMIVSAEPIYKSWSMYIHSLKMRLFIHVCLLN